MQNDRVDVLVRLHRLGSPVNNPRWALPPCLLEPKAQAEPARHMAGPSSSERRLNDARSFLSTVISLALARSSSTQSLYRYTSSDAGPNPTYRSRSRSPSVEPPFCPLASRLRRPPLCAIWRSGIVPSYLALNKCNACVCITKTTLAHCFPETRACTSGGLGRTARTLTTVSRIEEMSCLELTSFCFLVQPASGVRGLLRRGQW